MNLGDDWDLDPDNDYAMTATGCLGLLLIGLAGLLLGSAFVWLLVIMWRGIL